MKDNGQYDVNLFRARGPHAKANRNLILVLAIIWAVAVFGFQFLLIAFNEETPEQAYLTFQTVWPGVIETSAVKVEDRQVLSRSLLSVLGKTVTVSADHQTVLKEVLSWNVWIMAPDSARNLLTEPPSEATLQLAKETIGLASTGFDQIMVGLLPSTIVAVEAVELNPESIEALPGIMKLYLNHNQSCLTDTKFLGFPFHYWYTAQFLLILFVVLCVTYATLILRINKKHNFVEQT